MRQPSTGAGNVATLGWRLNADGTSKKRVKIYLLFGQSNATGQGDAADLPVALQGPQPGTFIQSGPGSVRPPCFQVQEAGFNTANVQGNGNHGLETTLSSELKAKYGGEDIYCIKIGAGGTAAVRDPIKEDWSTNSNELLDNGDFSLADDVLPAAMQCLCDDGIAPEWIGAIWVQGERDRSIGTSAADYQENERLLVSWVRKKLGVARLPFVSFLLPDFAVNNAAVNEAKVNNAAVIPSYIALAGGTSHVGDSIHYDSVALQDMGIRAATVL